MELQDAAAALRAADETYREAQATTKAARKLLDNAMISESAAYEARTKAVGVLFDVASPQPPEEANGRD